MQILIIGLGNIGHAMVSSISGENIEVDTVCTNKITCSEISNNLNNSHKIRKNYTYENLEKIDYDFIFLTLPYVQKIKRMDEIKDRISPNSTIVIVPANQGTYYYLPKSIQKNNSLILLERVPQIARIKNKYNFVNILGTKENLHYATKGIVDIEKFKSIYTYFENIIYLSNIDDISFISSNATIHTVRLYNLYKDGENFNKEIMFYADWTIEDAKLFINVENEILNIAQRKAKNENRASHVYDMYTHFNINPISEENVVDKISTNKSLKSITYMQKDVTDLIEDRYFKDDVMIGLYTFIELAKKYEVDVPTIKKIYNWGLTLSKEVYETKKLEI